ncbi:MAG: tetratricopeptide repeat protein [Chitinophagaceae bacterium]|nr:tetratricopeptide repeat protein [Chitinophagaceae bacterium]
MKRFILILPVLLLLFTATPAQTPMNKDSLLKLLPSAKEDSNAVLLYIDLGQQYENNEPDVAIKYYRMAGNLSKKINYTLGIIKYITNYTYMLNMRGQFDSSLILNLQSVEFSRKIKDSLYLAKTLFNTGTSYRCLANYEKAAAYYEEGKNIFRRFGDELTEAQGDDILQVLYDDLHQYEKAIQYGERAVSLLRKAGNAPMLGVALNNLGMEYASIGQLKKSDSIFTETLKLAVRIDDKNLEQSACLNLGNNYLQQGDFEKMKPYMDKALLLSKELEIAESELIALKGLSFYHTFKKNYPVAKQYAEEALALSYQHDLKMQRVKVFTQLSNLAYAMQDIELGEQYAKISGDLGDSLLNESIQKNTLELEKKYESANKETQIKKLEADKKIQELTIKQKNILNYILAGSAVIILIISLLGYRTYRQKQQLQQQRINELETQQQLTATEAVMKGEEQERSRLAKDLHDGLGGMLSGIKFSFNSMKGNLIMTPDNAQAFERSMDMLDSSIKEMRRVAHNLMPEALVKFGLDTALKDFCNDINQSGALQVSYQSIGLENEITNQTTAIGIYRIIQELINNSMKHAAAKNAIIQLSKSADTITLTVEDDGKGFDTTLLKTAKGMGWANIVHRVEFLKGKLDVNSQPGKGTSVLIEFAST